MTDLRQQTGDISRWLLAIAASATDIIKQILTHSNVLAAI